MLLWSNLSHCVSLTRRRPNNIKLGTCVNTTHDLCTTGRPRHTHQLGGSVYLGWILYSSARRLSDILLSCPLTVSKSGMPEVMFSICPTVMACTLSSPHRLPLKMMGGEDKAKGKGSGDKVKWSSDLFLGADTHTYRTYKHTHIDTYTYTNLQTYRTYTDTHIHTYKYTHTHIHN